MGNASLWDGRLKIKNYSFLLSWKKMFLINKTAICNNPYYISKRYELISIVSRNEKFSRKARYDGSSDFDTEPTLFEYEIRHVVVYRRTNSVALTLATTNFNYCGRGLSCAARCQLPSLQRRHLPRDKSITVSITINHASLPIFNDKVY